MGNEFKNEMVVRIFLKKEERDEIIHKCKIMFRNVNVS